MSTTMRAVVVKEYGGNDVVEVVDVDRRTPGVGEVLTRVHAAGVNPVDWKIRNGAGQRMGMSLPIHLGGEIAGTIAHLGEGVDEFVVGDAVYGIISTGGFAEYAIAKARDLVRKPGSLDFTEAAAIPLGALTAWQAMFDVANLSGGMRLLITNGSGGVGSLAIQIAKAQGVHVTAMASGRNESYVRSLGADEFVDHTAQPFEYVVRNMDVVFDTVGGGVFDRAFATLKEGGFLVTAVAFPNSETSIRDIGVGRVHCKPNADQLSAITKLVETGRLNARIATILPLEKVKEALNLSETGQASGKIVLQIVGLT